MCYKGHASPRMAILQKIYPYELQPWVPHSTKFAQKFPPNQILTPGV